MDKLINILCFSVNNWEKRKARKQQFMLHLSKREAIGGVFYIEPPLNFFRLLIFPFSELKNFENRHRWIRALSFKLDLLSDKLFLFTPIFFIPFSFRIQFIYNVNLYISLLIIKAKIKRAGFKNIVLWLYHPYDYYLLKWFKERILSCFDWAEEWAEYFIEISSFKRRMVKKLEEKIIKEVNVVFVVSKKLLDKAKVINPNSYVLLDGASPELFQQEINVPKDIAHLKKPIIGYTGTITERVNTDLLEFVSDSFPELSIVLIGDIHHHRVSIANLKKRNNIYFLGGKPYEQLPAYMKSFDVCIVPRRTEHNVPPPTKVFDYLASGKPVVSTNIPEIGWLKSYVKIAQSEEQFVEFIKDALKEDSLELRKLRLKIAEENSWAVRVVEILKIVNEEI